MPPFTGPASSPSADGGSAAGPEALISEEVRPCASDLWLGTCDSGSGARRVSRARHNCGHRRRTGPHGHVRDLPVRGRLFRREALRTRGAGTTTVDSDRAYGGRLAYNVTRPSPSSSTGPTRTDLDAPTSGLGRPADANVGRLRRTFTRRTRCSTSGRAARSATSGSARASRHEDRLHGPGFLVRRASPRTCRSGSSSSCPSRWGCGWTAVAVMQPEHDEPAVLRPLRLLLRYHWTWSYSGELTGGLIFAF